MTSVFLEDFAQTLAERGIATTRFEFAYMAARHMDGVKRPPPRIKKLVAEYRQLFAHLPRVDGQRLFIGGKSMGGRVASLLADELYADGHIAGAVCLGYPFHPSRKPDQLRVAHLASLACPTLIIQGTRDPLGSFDEVATYHLSPAITFAWLQDGDHVHQLSVGVNSVGRLPDNQVVLRDEHVSRRHCAIVVHRDGRCEVHDVASKNGTLVNGRKIASPTMLRPGDTLLLCTRKLTFLAGPQGAEPKPAA